MNKSKLNYLIDFIIFLFFLITAISGLVIFFFMPSGMRQGRWQEFLGIQKGIWTFFHNWAGIIFIALAVFHIILHWNWIVCMTKNVFKAEEKCDGNGK